MKIEGPITQEAVYALRGEVDLYMWKTQACARSWPKPPKQPGTAAQRKAWDTQKTFATWWENLEPSIREAWSAITTAPGDTGHDLAKSSGMTAAYRDALVQPPLITAATATPAGPGLWLMTLTTTLPTPAPLDKYAWRTWQELPGNSPTLWIPISTIRCRIYWNEVKARIRLTSWSPPQVASVGATPGTIVFTAPGNTAPTAVIPIPNHPATSDCALTPPILIP